MEPEAAGATFLGPEEAGATARRAGRLDEGVGDYRDARIVGQWRSGGDPRSAGIDIGDAGVLIEEEVPISRLQHLERGGIPSEAPRERVHPRMLGDGIRGPVRCLPIGGVAARVRHRFEEPCTIRSTICAIGSGIAGACRAAPSKMDRPKNDPRLVPERLGPPVMKLTTGGLAFVFVTAEIIVPGATPGCDIVPLRRAPPSKG